MDISLIDKNLKVETEFSKPDIVWLDSAHSPFTVYGAADISPYTRVPSALAPKISDGVWGLSRNTAGIRLRFKTNSPYIAIHCERNNETAFSHMTACGSSGFDLFSVSPATRSQSYVHTFVPPVDNAKGYDAIYESGHGNMTEYILNFPLYNEVVRLLIGVSSEADFEEPQEYSNALPVVFYGSSITQGGCASRPGNCYQNFLSRMLDMDYINLGFSGSGRAEDLMVEYMAGLDMCAFVSDYDHNAPTAEHLENTHYKMYQKIREKHPDIPYIIVSKPDYAWDIKRRCVIMKSYIRAINSGDRNVYFVDGASLLAGDEWDACTVDGCHPNDLGFYRFAKMLYPTLKTALKY